MLQIGHVFPDADYGGGGDRHPHASHSYCGHGFLQNHCFNSPDDPPGAGPQWYSLMLAVPVSMHQRMLATRPTTRLTVALVPWSQSGFGLLTLCAGAPGAPEAPGTPDAIDVIVGILDIAGRADLAELQAAERHGRLAVGIASDADPGVTPLVPVRGFSDALSEARLLRRLAARELVACVEEVRSILRGPAAHALLGITPLTKFATLSVNICPLA